MLPGLSMPPRWLPHRAEPQVSLPVPPPCPPGPGDREVTPVLAVIGGIHLWLLSRGYDLTTAAEITGEICLLATAVTGRLAAMSTGTLSKLMSVVKAANT